MTPGVAWRLKPLDQAVGRVLGNIFLPPVAYGGQLRWTRDLVQKDAAGRFPLAERLVAVARAYGFDGWFVNAETGGGNAALATDMLGFLRELKSRAAAVGQQGFDRLQDGEEAGVDLLVVRVGRTEGDRGQRGVPARERQSGICAKKGVEHVRGEVRPSAGCGGEDGDRVRSPGCLPVLIGEEGGGR